MKGEQDNEVSLSLEMKGGEIISKKEKKKRSRSKNQKKHKRKAERTESSGSLQSEESRLDKSDNMEDEQNKEARLSLEMKGEEVIFQKPKRKKNKCNEGDEDSNDIGFDLHEVQVSETLTVTHKPKKKKKKRSKVQLTREHCKVLDSTYSSIDLTDHTDSNQINTSMQTSCEKKLKKRKQEKRPHTFNISDNSIDDCEEGRPPMAKKKKLKDSRGDNNVETKLCWEAANENCVQVRESFFKRTKRKKKKRKRRNKMLSALSDSVFPETDVHIEKDEVTAFSNIVNDDMERNESFHKDYILIKRKNRNKKLKNITNHHETLESCPQNKENSNHICAKNRDFQNNDAQSSLSLIKVYMDSEIEENCVERIGAEVQRNQNVENSELTRYETVVKKQETSLVNNVALAALEENVKNSDSSRHGTSVKQDSFLEENDPTKTSSGYTNMPPATLEERDPEIAALHATSRVHPHPEFLKGLKEKGITWKVGKWNQQEISRLEANWNRIFQKYDYYGDRYDILNWRYGTDNEKSLRIRDFIRESQFYKRLGSGIKRPLNNIYYRARSMFAPDQSREFSENEIKELVLLQKQLGNRWSIIGERMKKKPGSVKRKWETIAKHMYNRVYDGEWTAEENRKLVKAVKRATGKEDVTGIYKNLSWKRIAEEISSRNEYQCKDQWKMKLCFSGTNDGRVLKRKFTAQEKVDFIDIIVDGNWQDEADINWEEMSMKFERTTPQYLQCKWARIKAYIENRKTLNFSELLEAILMGPYIRFLRRAESQADSEKMSLKHPRFNTLKQRMDVLGQDHEDMKSRYKRGTDFQTDGHNKCYITSDVLLSDTESDSS